MAGFSAEETTVRTLMNRRTTWVVEQSGWEGKRFETQVLAGRDVSPWGLYPHALSTDQKRQLMGSDPLASGCGCALGLGPWRPTSNTTQLQALCRHGVTRSPLCWAPQSIMQTLQDHPRQHNSQHATFTYFLSLARGEVNEDRPPESLTAQDSPL